MNPEERLTQVLTEVRSLHEKGALEGNDAIRMAELITEGKNLRAQVETRRSAGELLNFGDQSSGMLNLAGQTRNGGSIDAYTPAGTEHYERRDGQIVHADSEGEDVFTEAQIRAISSKEYKHNFRAYLRSARRPGQVGPEVNYRVLNEGSDGSGGLAITA